MGGRRYLLRMLLFSIFIVGSWDSNSITVDLHEGTKDPFFSSMEKLVEEEPSLHNSLIGISIRDPLTGELVFEHMGDIRLTPASSYKLLTAATAFSVLGPDYRFSTDIYTDGKIENGMLNGNLYIVGKGDVTLLKEDLDHLAKILANKGITSVEGELIGVNSWYDEIEHSIDLAWSDEEAYYGAPISALTISPDKDYDAGTIMLKVQPNKEMGKQAFIQMQPFSNEVQLINDTTTIEKDGKQQITISREHGTNHIKITGSIPVNANILSEWVSIQDPTLFMLDITKQSLQEAGIKVKGQTKKGELPVLSTKMHSDSSITLEELMISFMKLSNNTIAETLLKEIGKVKKGEGSFHHGIEAMKLVLKEYGVDTNVLLLRDGSGISPINYVTANEVTQLLFAIQKEPWFPSFQKSLPISGMEERMVGGTLRYRLNNEDTKGNVYAKTGTLSSISSLSGYVETKNNKQLIFSILINHMIDEKKAKEIEDKMVELLIKQPALQR